MFFNANFKEVSFRCLFLRQFLQLAVEEVFEVIEPRQYP